MSWLHDLFINEAKPALWRHSGSSSGPEVIEFPTAEPGFYRHGTNFTELLCTWDEYIEKGVDIDGQHYEGGINNSNGSSADSGYLMFSVPADVIIPQGYKYDLMSIECGNIVIPADAKSVSVMSYNYMHLDSNVGLTTLYIKDTTPDYFSLYESEVSPITKIVVPTGCANAYKSATGWCDYAEIMVEEGTVISGDDSVVGKSLAAKIIDQDPITEVTATDLQGLTKIPTETFSITGIFSYQDSMGFYYYDTIEKITLPETVTEIASNGISYVSNLNSLTVLAETPPTLGGSINGNGGGTTTLIIYVPAASVELYKAATNWSNYDIQAIA